MSHDKGQSIFYQVQNKAFYYKLALQKKYKSQFYLVFEFLVLKDQNILCINHIIDKNTMCKGQSKYKKKI